MYNCYCNICGQQMYSSCPNSGHNFCSAYCMAVEAIPFPLKNGQFMRFDADFRKKVSGNRSAVDAQPWPVVGPRFSYTNNRLLRIRGSRTQRLTTKAKRV